MKKLFLVSVSVLCLLLFSAPAKAGTITIDFDTYGFAAAAAQGITFVSLDNNPLIISNEDIEDGAIDNDTNKLKIAQSSGFKIIFDAGKILSYFSFDKWEAGSGVSPGTVYWQLYDYNGNALSNLSGANSTYDNWDAINPLENNNLAIGSIDIWGNTNGAYYVDNLKFELTTAVSEPLTLSLLGLGLMGLGFIRRKFLK